MVGGGLACGVARQGSHNMGGYETAKGTKPRRELEGTQTV